MRAPRFLEPVLASVSLAIASPALAGAAPARDGQVHIKPIAELRLRLEDVDQGPLNATAMTFRLRAGAEAKISHFSLLAEGEGTAAPVDRYNAFPYPVADRQRRPQYAVIADPENVELNRLQLQYKSKGLTATAGRQRINLDDQRWVGSVGWRQNEQTFDAVRGEAKLGPVNADVTYAIHQRTIFGHHGGARASLDGDFVFAGLGSKLGPVQGKLFAYFLDYDEAFYFTNSGKSLGGFLSAIVPVSGAKLALRASYARQSNYGRNPNRYSADYWNVEGSTAVAGLNMLAGYEELGSDRGHSVQTPMATLHKFNGWADLFLTTPPLGLQDAYASLGKSFGKRGAGLTTSLVYHRFSSAVGAIRYGSEWDASASVKIHGVSYLVKYANYRRKNFGLNTRKLWVQAEYAF